MLPLFLVKGSSGGLAKVAGSVGVPFSIGLTWRSFSSTIPQRSSIEVEKKFRYPEGTESKLLGNKAIFCGEKKFTDIYLDSPHFILTSKDIWFRKRDSSFECKVGSKDHRGVDIYKELVTEMEIRNFLKEITGKESSNRSFEEYLQFADLTPFASITTIRRKFKVEDFGIDLDDVDFGYRLGEVELLVEEGQTERASQRISELCHRLQLDTRPPIHGKVIEYLWKYKRDHYRQLELVGVIKLPRPEGSEA